MMGLARFWQQLGQTALIALLLVMVGLPTALLDEATAQNVGDLREQSQSLRSQRESIRRKKYEARKQAQQITSHILTNQRKLDQAQSTLRQNQYHLTRTRGELAQLNTALEQTRREHDVLYDEARLRVRRIYTSGRSNLLQMLLDAKDIPTFMDRMTYKRYLVGRDHRLLSQLRSKESIYRQQVEARRRREMEIDFSIRNIESLRGSISDRLLHDKKLREQYWRDAAAYERAERDLLAESRRLEAEIRALTARASAGGRASQATGGFIWPLRGTLTSPFGYRRHPIHRKRLMHTGLDISRPHGTAIAASNSGTVIFSGWRGGYGRTVMINHGTIGGKNIVTLYGHMSSNAVSTGQHVNKGQVVGRVGSTGYSTGPHLHFEVRENGSPVDPRRYL